MKRSALLIALLIPLTAAYSRNQKPVRPRITGIGSVSIDVQDAVKGKVFYMDQLGFGAGLSMCNGRGRVCLGVNGHQMIELQMFPKPTNNSMLQEVTFETEDLEQLRQYLSANGFKVGVIEEMPKFNRRFSLVDPDGQRIGFIQYLTTIDYSHAENQAGKHIIHAGFVVRDRTAEDHFYGDILGFHLYWHGGMKDGETSWVDMQVPDGTDWLEYMLNIQPDPDSHTLGVMNHIALGVTDIQAAKAQLVKNGAKLTEEPKIGRDGKSQLNLYDPDDTRVELMEFTPVQKPCCSEFTGPHPGPHQ